MEEKGSTRTKEQDEDSDVLGCLLYCITTQRLTRRLREHGEGNQPAPPRYFPGDSSDEESVNFWEDEELERRPAAFLYVENTALVDAVPLAEATNNFNTGPTGKCLSRLNWEEILAACREELRVLECVSMQRRPSYC